MKDLTEQGPLGYRAAHIPAANLPLVFAHRSCQSMTSLFSSTMSPVKDGTSSLPRRQTSFSKPPLRALYDLLIGPMEGVSLWHRHLPKPSQGGKARTVSWGLVSEV